ncbi:4-hydroxybenzoate polyprenyltransferase [Haloferula luteola]|uniref:4-hydroxybenzoate polyprenyltransferase n=1 Tax=Haloferula luteola TaxID=595692 RepID=A0A840UYF8_9BACT|nr:UbiA family prenyltransferase [Haloferula luteola]MBB5350812.1 4-hydroxybenzoate polyprenyltransferase [Haloferula luteola]
MKSELEVPDPGRRLSSEPPLAVDLDGTLFRVDTLWEGVARMLRRDPQGLLLLPLFCVRGKPYLKRMVAERSGLLAEHLPWNEAVVAFLEEEKAQGRRLLLVSGADFELAKRLTEKSGLFEEWWTTEEKVNLIGKRKGQRLVEVFGEGGFDYLGNSMVDVEVWSQCRRVHVTNPDPGVLRRLRQMGKEFEFHGDLPRPWRSGVRQLRCHQWVKNLLVLVPLLASHRFYSAEMTATGLAFLCFSLGASSVYLLNDLLDLEHDRKHPVKRFRPAAVGEVPVLWLFAGAPVLAMVALGLSLVFLPPSFTLTLGFYFFLTLAYSFRLKQVAMVDVVVLAMLYTLRIVGGAFAIGVVPSPWILAFSLLMFTSLAFAKRHGEIMGMWADPHRPEGEQVPGRGYRLEHSAFLPGVGMLAGTGAVVVAGFYAVDENTRELYAHPEYLWGVLPVFLFWLNRLWRFADRGVLHADPVLFAVKDPFSWLCGIALVGIGLAAL